MRQKCLAALALTAAASAAAFSVRADDTRVAAAALEGDAAAIRALLAEGAAADAPGADGTRALHWAVRRDDLPSVELLLRAGADARAPNDFGVTPLALAAANGNAGVIERLLAAGASANAGDPAGETMLMIAARSGSVAAVRMLLDRGAVVDARDTAYRQTALMIAVRENHAAVAALLVERGADVDAQTRIGDEPAFRPPNAGGGSHGIGIVRGGWPEQGARAATPGGLTPLLYAARDGRLDAAKLLLDAGADVELAEANAVTPLMMAIINNQIAVARLLVEHGANVNASDWYGRTPLWTAVDTRNLDVDSSTFANGVDRGPVLELIESLLARGAEPNARTKEIPPIRRFMMPLGSLSWVDFTGQTPFLRAALAGDVTVMRLLLRHGADPSIGTFGGTTPLAAAAGVNWVVNQTYDEGADALLEAVKLCHELGNDPNAANSMGLRAIHGAANRGSDDIVRWLAAHGADLDAIDNDGRTPLAWAQGVFLATHAAEPKPSTAALLEALLAE
jgi:ankyrin repeat protein